MIDPAGKVSYIHVLLSVDPEPLEKLLREAIEQVLPKEQDDQYSVNKVIYLGFNRRGRRGPQRRE